MMNDIQKVFNFKGSSFKFQKREGTNVPINNIQ